MSKMFKSQVFWVLLGFTFLGFFLRIHAFSAITFGYDQARDVIIAGNIWKGDLKILGPNSDIHGLHHGALYWYLISPFYVLSGNNIFAVKIFMVLSNLLVVPITYILSKKIFGNTQIALISAFLITVSYEAISYSRWLSNPSLAIVTIPLSFLFLWMYVKENYRWGLLLTAFFWGISIQFQIFLLYQAVIFLLILIVFRKIKIMDILLSAIVFFIVISPLILAEIRFNFIAIKGITEFFTGYAGERGQTISEMWGRAVSKILLVPYYNFISSSGFAAFFMLLFSFIGVFYSVILKDKRVIFIFLWFIAPFFLFFVGSTNIYFIFIGCVVPLCILTAFYVYNLLSKYRAYLALVLFLGIILASNIYLLFENQGKGEMLFSVQTSMVYDDEVAVLDYVYEEAQGKPFRINTITNPLFVNTTWSYMFDTYGRKTYGYMPFYWGYPQDGRIGEEISYSTDFENSDKLLFIIIEPSGGIPEFFTSGIIEFEDTRSQVLEEKKFGEFIVQKRLIAADKPFSMEEVHQIIKQ